MAINRPQDIPTRKRALEVARSLIENPALNLSDAANAVGAGRFLVSCALLIIQHGTPEEIALAEEGLLPLRESAVRVRARVSTADRAAKRKPLVASQETKNMRMMEMEVWHRLRDGLLAINNLPAPKDTAAIVRKHATRVETVNRHLLAAIAWIKEFEDEITK